MKSFLTKKNILPLLVFLQAGFLYIYFLSLEKGPIINGSLWFIAFFKMLLFYYFIFVASTLLQILSIKCFHLFPINVFSLYPVAFDGTLSFHPIRLLYNVEGFSNALILNLAQYINNEELLAIKMKQLLYIRKCCYFLAYGILFMYLQQYNLITFFIFLLAFLGTVFISYFQFGSFWYGYDYIYGQGAAFIREYLYASKTIMFLNAAQYADALHKEHRDDFFVLAIAENYVYRSIIERNQQESAQLLEHTLATYIEANETCTYDLTLDTKLLHVIKVIGWAGIICENTDMLQLSIAMYSTIYEVLLYDNAPIYVKHAAEKIEKELEYLRNHPPGLPCQLHIQNMQNIFNFYNKIWKF